MKNARLLSVLMGLALVGASVAVGGVNAPEKTTAKYVCPPCPVDCHGVEYEKPGNCPKCHMPLVLKSSIKNVAILVYEGVELLDFAGPGEVFAAAGGHSGGGYNMYTIAGSTDAVTSQGFVSVNPKYAATKCPPPDILVIPGGRARSVIDDKALMAWIKETVPRTQVVLSVCNGALVLAYLGLLDGLEATTHHGSIEKLRDWTENTKVYEDRRFVDNGKIVTAAGVSAGIDAALHVVARLNGRDVAEGTARYMEYRWDPDPKVAHSESR